MVPLQELLLNNKLITMRNNKIVFLLIAVVFASSCTKKPDVEYTAPYKFAGEWWVTLMVNGQDVYKLGHVAFATFNTSANTNEIWVDDLKHGYGFKVKATTDPTTMGFTATNAANQYYNSATPAAFPKTVILNNGKVLEGAGKTRSGNVADSIYMEAEFVDDPGTKYIISGHQRTGFFEDEY
jgi:hypothetical protein